MFWAFLVVVTAACWFLAFVKPVRSYPRDWRLKVFHLTRQEEQDFHFGVQRVIALTCAIFFTACLMLAAVLKLT